MKTLCLSTFSVLLAVGCATSDGIIPAENGVREELLKGPTPVDERLFERVTPDDPLDPMDYVVGPGDALRIEVKGVDGKLVEDLSGDYTVPLTGFIVLNYIGRTQVSGKTLREIAESYANGLVEKKVLASPQIDIFVNEYRTRHVTLSGALKNTGTATLPDTERRSLQVLLCTIGRPLPGADVEKIAVRRGVKTFVLSWFELEQRGEKFYLEPGDVIDVPQAAPIRVRGEVENPGEFPFEGTKSTLRWAIEEKAKGLARFADSDVILRRRTPDGAVNSYRVDFDDILDDEKPDLPLYPGDEIVVETDELGF
ncbi:MAG: polysaccharide biosynthesis/export family protein [Planctomycetes bacterium]|nr:polysaccharide biosynthesis/export family protein [Planctomycetota bacterium]